MPSIQTYDWIVTVTALIFNWCDATIPVQKLGTLAIAPRRAAYPAANRRNVIFHTMEV